MIADATVKKGHALKTEDYLNQSMYFSESQHEFLEISEMAFPHAAAAFRKIIEEFGFDTVHGTILYLEFMQVLRPPLDLLAAELDAHGKAAFMVFTEDEVKIARSRFYRAAKRIGKRVKTYHQDGSYILRGEVIGPVIKVRGKEVS